MSYEIVNLEEKILVGVSATTGNNDPMMGAIIGGLWGKLYQEGISQEIKNKVNEFAIGLYSDYEEDKYCVTVGHEVTRYDNPELSKKIIPAGRYAKFSAQGPMQKVVQDAWNEIWNTKLDRSYTGDFEEYLDSDMENGRINFYIALKE